MGGPAAMLEDVINATDSSWIGNIARLAERRLPLHYGFAGNDRGCPLRLAAQVVDYCRDPYCVMSYDAVGRLRKHAHARDSWKRVSSMACGRLARRQGSRYEALLRARTERLRAPFRAAWERTFPPLVRQPSIRGCALMGKSARSTTFRSAGCGRVRPHHALSATYSTRLRRAC